MLRPLCFLLICVAFICAAFFFYHRLTTRHGDDSDEVPVSVRSFEPVTLGFEAGPGLIAYQLDEKAFGPKTLSMIQSDSGILLPSGSRGLKFVYSPPIDPSWAAKIEIPREAAASILARLSKTTGEKINISGEIGPRMIWWRAHDAKILLDRQSSPGGNYLRTTLTEEAGSMILYIEWSVF